MKILIVSQYFPPEMGAPQARLFELSQRMRKRGHEVTVVTGMPNYPGGRIFPEYRRKILVSEDMEGIRVLRSWLFASNSQSILPRLFSYLTFAFTSCLFGLFRIGRHDIALVESPPLFIAPTGLLLAAIARARTVFMVSDIWPDILVRMGKASPGPALSLMLWLERWAYRHYDVTALTNPGAMDQILERFPGTRATVISNGVDTNMFRPDLRSDIVRQDMGAGPDTILVGYCGLHGMAQGLDTVVDACPALEGQPDIRLVFIGSGPCKGDLEKQARDLGVKNLEFRGRMPKEQMPAVVASCDIMLVPLSDRLPGTMPSKVYEALASGTPVIIAKGCEGEPLVEDHEVGASFEPGDATELAQALLGLARDRERLRAMRPKARQVADRFSRDRIGVRTESLFQAILSDEELPRPEW